MLESLRARQPGAPLIRIVWWYCVQIVCYTWLGVCYGFRAWGMNYVPRKGPVLFLSNHQSFIDPIAIGIAAHHRQCYAMARSSLFRNPIFGGLIRSVNAFPVERGETDMAAIRRAIGVLKQGNALLVFPEGTRTPDGTTKAFAKGTMLLIKKAKPLVIPVAVEGGYDIWPRSRTFMKLTGKFVVEFGQPVTADELIRMGAKKGLEHIHQEVENIRHKLARRLELIQKHGI